MGLNSSRSQIDSILPISHSPYDIHSIYSPPAHVSGGRTHRRRWCDPHRPDTHVSLPYRCHTCNLLQSRDRRIGCTGRSNHQASYWWNTLEGSCGIRSTIRTCYLLRTTVHHPTSPTWDRRGFTRSWTVDRILTHHARIRMFDGLQAVHRYLRCSISDNATPIVYPYGYHLSLHRDTCWTRRSWRRIPDRTSTYPAWGISSTICARYFSRPHRDQLTHRLARRHLQSRHPKRSKIPICSDYHRAHLTRDWTLFPKKIRQQTPLTRIWDPHYRDGSDDFPQRNFLILSYETPIYFPTIVRWKNLDI